MHVHYGYLIFYTKGKKEHLSVWHSSTAQRYVEDIMRTGYAKLPNGVKVFVSLLALQ